MNKQTIDLGIAVTLAPILVSIGCNRDNGLPADIESDLAERGITIEPTRTHVPLTGRHLRSRLV